MLKRFIRRMIYRYRADSESYIKFLKKKGCRIGDGTVIYDPRNTLIDFSYPWLIEIGDNVQIASGVKILTHGYDWSVLKHYYGHVLGSAGRVKIGNNVFIGVNSTILKGITIGNDVIIGANSLVNKDIITSGVWAGNPICYITDLQSYFEKRLQKQVEEAKELAVAYYSQTNKIPPKEIFHEFFWLFEKKNTCLIDTFENKLKLTGNYEKSYNAFMEYEAQFADYDEFIQFCGLT